MGSYSFHQIHLNHEQWDDISESARRFFEYNQAAADCDNRQEVGIPELFECMSYKGGEMMSSHVNIEGKDVPIPTIVAFLLHAP